MAQSSQEGSATPTTAATRRLLLSYVRYRPTKHTPTWWKNLPDQGDRCSLG